MITILLWYSFAFTLKTPAFLYNFSQVDCKRNMNSRLLFFCYVFVCKGLKQTNKTRGERKILFFFLKVYSVYWVLLRFLPNFLPSFCCLFDSGVQIETMPMPSSFPIVIHQTHAICYYIWGDSAVRFSGHGFRMSPLFTGLCPVLVFKPVFVWTVSFPSNAYMHKRAVTLALFEVLAIPCRLCRRCLFLVARSRYNFCCCLQSSSSYIEHVLVCWN